MLVLETLTEVREYLAQRRTADDPHFAPAGMASCDFVPDVDAWLGPDSIPGGSPITEDDRSSILDSLGVEKPVDPDDGSCPDELCRRLMRAAGWSRPGIFGSMKERRRIRKLFSGGPLSKTWKMAVWTAVQQRSGHTERDDKIAEAIEAQVTLIGQASGKWGVLTNDSTGRPFIDWLLSGGFEQLIELIMKLVAMFV